MSDTDNVRMMVQAAAILGGNETAEMVILIANTLACVTVNSLVVDMAQVEAEAMHQELVEGLTKLVADAAAAKTDTYNN